MDDLNNQIGWLLATDAFRSLLENDLLSTAKLNAAIALLIKARIPFDVVFTPGTRRVRPQAVITININPNTTISFTVRFESQII